MSFKITRRPYILRDWILLAALAILTVLYYFFLKNLAAVSCDVSGICTTENYYSLFLTLYYVLLVADFIYLAYLVILFEKKAVVGTTGADLFREETVVPTETKVTQKNVVIKDITTRKKYEPFATVENGYYLEIDDAYDTSNRTVSVTNGVLPKVVKAGNKFVSVSKEEKTLLSFSGTKLHTFVKFTPGSYVDAGYYVEVDLHNEAIDNYIYTEKRLPPTTTKGHRWVRIIRRSVK
jgi:hypothetical protein